MGNDTLQIRFTDEKYSSRIDVARALGTNLIDQIWQNILAYRKEFEEKLPIVDITKAPLTITNGYQVKKFVSSIDDRAAKFIEKFSNLKEDGVDKYTFTREMVRIELNHIARLRNIHVNDIAIGNIINRKGVNIEYLHLTRYYDVIKEISQLKRSRIDIDQVAYFFGKLNGETELTSFYRVNEIDSNSQRVLINKEYAGCPVNLIEEQMDALISFANCHEFSTPVKAAFVYYYVNYIKPFDKFNEEMALILSRLVFVNGGMEGAVAYVPVEKLSTQRSFEYSLAAKEVQKSKDSTYIVLILLELLNEGMLESLDKLATISVQKAGDAFYKGEDPVKIAEEFGPEAVEEKDKEEIQPEPEPQPAPKEEIPAEIKKEPWVKQPKPKVVDAPVVVTRPTLMPSSSDLSEKELKRLERDMLESDPTLKPAQAKFYVRHCTPGKFYTIEQYKKSIGCVYETARTSMDTLAKKGYYQREKVNNKKFVYTPIVKD